MSTGSGLQLVSQSSTGKTCERGTRKAIFWSVTYNKYILIQSIQIECPDITHGGWHMLLVFNVGVKLKLYRGCQFFYETEVPDLP